MGDAMTQTTTEREFRVLYFTADLATFIDYGRIAEMARSIGGAFTVTYGQDGSARVRVFWSESEA